MLSSKMLFLGVYSAEGGILRVLFQPLCYLFLSSPFALLVSRYYGLHQKALEHIPQDYKTPDIWPQLFVAIVAILLVTRVISGKNIGASKDGGKRRVQFLPYWIPGIKHLGNIVVGGDGWLRNVRDTSITNVVAYKYSGTKHNLILSAPILDRIVGNSDSLEEAKITKLTTVQNVYGLPSSAKKQYLNLHPSISETLVSEVFGGIQLETLSSSFLRNLSEALPDLITFNSSIVDQFPWERLADIELTDGNDEVECHLFALINEFFCKLMSPLITGHQFVESYDFLSTDLANLNLSFYSLALGLPRLFPVPGLPNASFAKRRLLQNLIKLYKDLTSPPVKREIPEDESVSGDEETDADTPTPATALNDLFSQHNLPVEARASITLQLIHQLYSKVVPLAFWTVLHIYRLSAPADSPDDKAETPLSSIRKETRTWAEAIQPPSIHPSFPAPPEISFSSVSTLYNPSACTYLRSCIAESKRLYSSRITTAKITKPIVFSDILAPRHEEEWELEAGSYLDIGLSERLINTSVAEHLSPGQYKPGRSAYTQPPAPLAATMFDASGEFVDAMLLSSVAGITQLWDISAAPKKGFFEQMQEAQAAATGQDTQKVLEGAKKKGVWVVPKTVDGATVLLPRDDVRVRIRRREGLEEKKSARSTR